MKYAFYFLVIFISMNLAAMQPQPKTEQSLDCCMLAGLVKAIAKDCYHVGVCKSKDYGYAVIQKPCEYVSYYLKDSSLEKVKQE